MTQTQTTLEMIRGCPAGRSWASRSEVMFVEAHRSETGYRLRCGWVVPEAYDDDPDSCSLHPFASSRYRCWVGRELVCAAAEQAAQTFDRWLEAVSNRRSVSDGERIGSVAR